MAGGLVILLYTRVTMCLNLLSYVVILVQMIQMSHEVCASSLHAGRPVNHVSECHCYNPRGVYGMTGGDLCIDTDIATSTVASRLSLYSACSFIYLMSHQQVRDRGFHGTTTELPISRILSLQCLLLFEHMH